MLWLLLRCSIFPLWTKFVWLFWTIKELCELLRSRIEKDVVVHGSSHKSIANPLLLHGKTFDGTQQSARAPTGPLSTTQVLLVSGPVVGPISPAWRYVLNLVLGIVAVPRFVVGSDCFLIDTCNVVVRGLVTWHGMKPHPCSFDLTLQRHHLYETALQMPSSLRNSSMSPQRPSILLDQTPCRDPSYGRKRILRTEGSWHGN